MNINKFPDFTFRANVKWLGAFLCAALISLLLFKVAGIANEKYYERWPLQGDTMSYWSRDIALSKIPVPNGSFAIAPNPSATCGKAKIVEIPSDNILWFITCGCAVLNKRLFIFFGYHRIFISIDVDKCP